MHHDARAMRIRRARDEDAEDILELDRELFTAGEPPLELEGLTLWVAHEGEELAGYAAARMSYHWADAVYLARAGVAPAFRGRGLQRRFIRARERWARAQGARRCITDTAPSNAASTNSLIRCGYRMITPECGPWAGSGATYWGRRLTRNDARKVMREP